MELKFFNTDGRQIQPFIPLKKREVGMYCCGPTVYNYAHIGNLRTYLFEDILRRILERNNYKVNHIMNITDVGHLTDDGDEGEDKMVKSSREKGMSVWEIALFFTDAFFIDTDRLNIKRPVISCPATEHIEIMIDLVKKLEEGGFAYQSGGNVYFDISKFSEYGKIALLDRQELKAGSRIEVDKNKRNPQDFVLWFTDSKFGNQTMSWDSPWGRGYPGWHLECSAMSMKYLGEQFDIHCGGIDHIPVHHTNEIAQSEAATGKKWVNYWIHGEFLVLNKGKMSKSSGTFLTLQTLIDEGYEPLDYRYFLLGGHYRSQLQFGYESLDSAKTARGNLSKRVKTIKKDCGNEPAKEILHVGLLDILKKFDTDCADDMNMPRALSRVYALLKEEAPQNEKLAALYSMDEVLGLSLKEIQNDEDKVQQELEPELQTLIKEREEARAGKNFSESDRLRDLLLEKGITVKDSAQGTIWTRV